MARELIYKYPFWSNAGTGAITGLASGSVIYFTPGGTSVAAGAAGSWAKIKTYGADYCLINYRVKMSNWGGASVSSGTGRISAIGCPFEHSDSDLDSLYALSGSPESTWVIASAHADGLEMVAKCWGTDQNAMATVSDKTPIDQGIFPSGLHGTATAGGGWTASLGIWTPYAATAGTGAYTGYDQPLLVSGLDHIHLAVSTFTTLTSATVANIRAKAALDVLFYREIAYTKAVARGTETRVDLRMAPGPPVAP